MKSSFELNDFNHLICPICECRFFFLFRGIKTICAGLTFEPYVPIDIAAMSHLSQPLGCVCGVNAFWGEFVKQISGTQQAYAFLCGNWPKLPCVKTQMAYKCQLACQLPAQWACLTNLFNPPSTSLPIFDQWGVERRRALPRWRQPVRPALGFILTLQKPMGGVTVALSTFFYHQWVKHFQT